MKMQSLHIRLAGALLVLLCTALFAYPPYIPFEDRIKQSEVVLIGRVLKVDTSRHVGKNRIVYLRIKVLEALKGAPPGKTFGLTFLVFPNTEESHLLTPPKKGNYIFFLNKKKVTDSRGRTGFAIVLYNPRVYAYEEATEDNISKIKLLFQK